MSTLQRCALTSATIIGVEAHPVSVEVAVSSGLPSFSVVGMPDTAIQESRERVRAAIKSSGFSMPRDKVVVNLAPGFLKKTGSGFDLPIALGILAATGQIPACHFKDSVVVGELSLAGEVRPVRGLFAFQECAQDMGVDLISGPCTGMPEPSSGSRVLTAERIRDFLEGEFGMGGGIAVSQAEYPDFGDVGGQRLAKRALAIAAAGGHGVLMMGPPGAGKSMLASRLPSILPLLDSVQRLQSAKILSVAGDAPDSVLAGRPPFRAPHHSATLPGLCGGGNPVRPGEVTLAHNGVLFLDELSEFSTHVLQSLRQPLEDGYVTITRADGTVVMPSSFLLVAASNPCPCGYFGDDRVECTCPPLKVAAYQNRIGGPLIDRIDICLDVWRADFQAVAGKGDDLDSQTLASMVASTREFAAARNQSCSSKPSRARSKRSVRSVLEECQMDSDTLAQFKALADAHVLSGRGIMRTLAVARTIADMEQSARVRKHHVAEAMNLRVRGGGEGVAHG